MFLKKRKAFTMIELIFAIVIIGILAAVAIPKLTATRDDAQVAKVVANLKILTQDVINYYTANGENTTNNATGAWGVVTYDVVTNAVPKTGVLTGAGNFNVGFSTGEQCFTVVEGTQTITINNLPVTQRILTITDGPDSATRICVSALGLARDKGLHTPGNADIIVFAGQSLTF